MLSVATINKWYNFRIDRCAPCLYFYAVEIAWFISIFVFCLFLQNVPCRRSHLRKIAGEKKLEEHNIMHNSSKATATLERNTHTHKKRY